MGDFALFISKGDNTRATSAHEYLHRDHIGSIVAISKGTIASVADINWQANGAWGERRFNQWNGPLDNLLIPTSTAKGFTDHEHLDSVGLIHMSGRVYDPELGRFMSADPFVQAPYNSQSYNRYSYVFNNPLSFTDPSGYTCVGTGYAPGACGSDSNTEQTRVYCDYSCQEAARLKREAQQNAINQSNIASWRASESRDQHWAYMNGAAYNIANIWGMTEFALAAGGYFPDALRKEINNIRPMDVLDFIAHGVNTGGSENATYAGTQRASGALQSHVLKNPRGYIGLTKFRNNEGRHECVFFPQQVSGAGHTSGWKAGGAPTKDTPVGTWIATFVNGIYIKATLGHL